MTCSDLLVDGAEAAEDDHEVVVGGDRIEFADEEHVLGRGRVGRRQVADHFQDGGARFGLALGQQLFDLLGRLARHVVDVLVGSDPPALRPSRLVFITPLDPTFT